MILWSKSPYSPESLAMLICSAEKDDEIVLSGYSFEFTGSVATVTGYIKCFFDIQDESGYPYSCDLVDAVCDIESVEVSFDDEKIKHLTVKEIKELNNLVQKFIL